MTSDWFLLLTSVWPSQSTARRIELMEVDLDDGVVYLDYGDNIGEDDKAGGDHDDDRSMDPWRNSSRV